MPRNVRNFWVELSVDGAASRVETGPRSANGGFAMRILMRENGGISDKSVHVEGRVMSDGTLRLMAYADGQEDTLVVQTKR